MFQMQQLMENVQTALDRENTTETIWINVNIYYI